MERRYLMKKKYFNRTGLMAAVILLPSLFFALPVTGLANSESSDIILLFCPESDINRQRSVLSLMPKDSLLWHENGAALLRVEAKSAPLWLSYLREDSAVAAADYDAPVTALGISQDAYSDAQWGLNNDGSYSYIADMNTSTVLSTSDIDMNIPEAWALYSSMLSSPREVVVAVIDTGIDINHPDLAANIWVNPGEIPGDNIDNDNNGFIDDTSGWDFYNGDNTVCHYDTDGIHTLASDNDDHGTHVPAQSQTP